MDNAALLDQLMGADRNVSASERSARNIWDRGICPFFLCGLSPWQELRGATSAQHRALLTQAYDRSIGVRDPGRLVCDASLRREWRALPQAMRDKYGFERALLHCLDDLIQNVERRSLAALEKSDEAFRATVMAPVDAEKLAELECEMEDRTREAECLGKEGRVVAAAASLKAADDLRRRCLAMELDNRSDRARPNARCPVTGEIIDSNAIKDDAWMVAHQASPNFQSWARVRDLARELRNSRRGHGPPQGIAGYRHDQDARFSSRAPAYEDRGGGFREYRHHDAGHWRDDGGRHHHYGSAPAYGRGRERSNDYGYGRDHRRQFDHEQHSFHARSRHMQHSRDRDHWRWEHDRYRSRSRSRSRSRGRDRSGDRRRAGDRSRGRSRSRSRSSSRGHRHDRSHKRKHKKKKRKHRRNRSNSVGSASSSASS